MSNNGNNTQRITCPSCHCEILVNPVSVIMENTEELHSLIQGTLNKFNCSSCKVEFLYDTPIIYRDDENHFVIYHHTSGTHDTLPEALNYMSEIYKELFADFSEDEKPVCRLTMRRKDLIEKIKIHQLGYDDRIIEYIKYQFFSHSSELDESGMDLLFDFATSTEEKLVFLAFDQHKGDVLYSLEFPTREYHQLKNNFLDTPELEKEFSKLFKGYYVHVSTLLE